MATYVVLTNFTREGAMAVKDSPNRFEAGQSLLNLDFESTAAWIAPIKARVTGVLVQLATLNWRCMDLRTASRDPPRWPNVS
jgi:hypothetical protein